MKIRVNTIIKNGIFLFTLIISQCVGSAYACLSKGQNPDVEKLSLTSLSGQGIPSTQNLPLKAIDRTSLTTVQRLTLLKEEVGMMRHSMDDFAAFIVNHGLQSPEVADHYQDYLSSHQFKIKGVLDGQKALSIYRFISTERLVDKDFLQYCDLALEAILKFQETLSKSSIEVFYREALIALNQNANTIYESVCSYLEKEYPNIFYTDSLGRSVSSLTFEQLNTIFNKSIDISYYTLWINLCTKSSFIRYGNLKKKAWRAFNLILTKSPMLL